jgi:dihydrofolate reductase
VWGNSRAIDEALTTWVRHALPLTDVVVIGSGSVVEALTEQDLVDEYRLLMFPTATGSGRRLFPASHRFELTRTEQVGPAVLCFLTPDRA